MSKSNYNQERSEFIEAVNGIGDILVFDTQRKSRNKSTENNLKRLQRLAEKFLQLQESEPEKFKSLFFTEQFSEISNKNEDEAQFRLSIDPEGYTTAFTSLLDQISRVHEQAIRVENDQISRYTTYIFIWLLKSLTTEPDRDVIIEIILKQLRQMGQYAIEQDDPSKYDSVIGWYTGTIFNLAGEEEFALSYLPVFDKYFFYSIRKIVDHELEDLLDQTVKNFFGITPRLSSQRSFYEVINILYRSERNENISSDFKINMESILNDLSEIKTDIDTVDAAINWKDKLENIFMQLRKELPESSSEEITEIEKEIKRTFLDKIKLKNLRKLTWKICAYCMYREKTEFIKKLWTKETNEDSMVIRAGHTIVPNSVSGVVNQFIDFEFYLRRFDPWLDVVNPGPFYRKYFFLLLIRNSRSIFSKQSSEDNEKSIPQEILDEFNNIRTETDNIQMTSQLASAMENLKEELNKFIDEEEQLIKETIEIDREEVKEIVDSGLRPLLNKIQDEANRKVEYIELTKEPDPEKIQEFENDFIEGYNETATIRQIFEKFQLYVEMLDKSPNEVDIFGINQVDQKAIFFSEWHIDYPGWGKQYGKTLAFGENRTIVKKVFQSCDKIERSEFEDKLQEFSKLESLFILAEGTSFQKWFRDSDREFHYEYFTSIKSDLDIASFVGEFEYEKVRIPVLQFHNEEIESVIGLFDRDKFPKLIQYNPHDNEDGTHQSDIFKFEIKSFSEDKEMLDKMLEDPPSWLIDKSEDREEQKKHLQKRVLIKIYEKFEINIPDDFIGFSFKV